MTEQFDALILIGTGEVRLGEADFAANARSAVEFDLEAPPSQSFRRFECFGERIQSETDGRDARFLKSYLAPYSGSGSFLALLLRTELEDRLAAKGHPDIEWARLLMDLDRLEFTDIEQHGKRFRLRNETSAQVTPARSSRPPA